MKKRKRLLSVCVVAVLLVCMFASVLSRVWGSETPPSAPSQSPVIDPLQEGSLTIYKLLENDGNVKNGTGQADSSLQQEGMEGVVFTALKIADIETMTQTSTPTGSSTSETTIGVYFTNLNSGFANLFTANSISLTSQNIGGTTCYSTEDLADSLTRLCSLGSTSGNAPGEVQINSFVKQAAGKVDFTATDANGRTSRSGLPLGLYLVAETNYEGYSKDGYTFADNTTVSEIVGNPTSPFLVSLPMSNQGSDSSTYWQYQVTAYPKNQTVVIPKFLIDETDGTTLTQSGDYEIGEIVHQVIAPSAPAVAHLIADNVNNRVYEKYEIMDVMENGLSFKRLVSVKIGHRAYDLASTNDFSGFDDLILNRDYRIYSGTEGNNSLNESNASGVKAFRIVFLEDGLEKLNDLEYDAQVAVFFDAVVTKNAVVGVATANKNTPRLTWKFANTEENYIDGNQPKVYSYRIDLLKKGTDDPTKVSFSIKKGDSDISFIRDSAGIYHLFDNDTDSTSAKTTMLIPASTGKLIINGLDSDTYIFTERSTESGRELLKSTFQVTLTGKDPVDGNLLSATLSSDGKSTAMAIDKGTAALSVKNFKSLILRTGGEGTAIFGIAAILMLCAGLVFMLIKRRKEKA